ncbi:MAG: 3-deoxy-manno-octulosonate cytidylyltransferase [Bryobacteraceae bacterium]|nr:3-deoxy-manno-octulosonate cytidylyltransferase [Bryobacteraceae bacterium]
MPATIVGIIPARYASSRFPGKALARLAGKTVLQHVWERASQARYLRQLIVATDDDRIRDEARSFGAKVAMTRADHLSGTDRVAEAASSSDAAIVVNIQGDEPLIDPSAIDALAVALVDDEKAPMATLKKRIEDLQEFTNPNVVKVVTDRNHYAIYFSRSPIPYDLSGEAIHYKHPGLYAYRREFLLAYSDLPVGPLERAERLEQLRAIENGHKIRVVETEYESVGVDTPQDLERVRRLMQISLDR